MRHAVSFFCAGALLVFCPLAGAQETTRILCDEDDPDQGDMCVGDTLEVVFAGQTDPATDSIFEYAEFERGREITVEIIMDVTSDQIQGWAYGVAHDPRILEIQSVTTEGTDARQCSGLFDATSIDVATCGPDPECSPESRTPGGGFTSAIVFFCGKVVHLPLGRNVVARATYKLREDAGVEGTFVQFTDRLARRMAPPTPLSVTVDGWSKLWSTATEGRIQRSGGPSAREFIRGDSNDDAKVDLADPIWTIRELMYGGPPSACPTAADSNDDGILDIADAACTIRWLLQGGAAPPAPFPACGSDPTAGGLPCPAGTVSACP
jgi:hypothetical protein